MTARPPDWQDDEYGVKLYCADCLDILPTIEGVDITITSPPYNTLPQTHSPSGLRADRKTGIDKWALSAVNGYNDNMPEGEYQSWVINIIEYCIKASKGLVWMNHKIRYREGVALHPARIFPWPIYLEVIWNRGGSMALNCKRYAPSHEGLWAFGKPHYWDDTHNMSMSVWRIPNKPLGIDHPCPYPISLIEKPIESSCPLSGVVLDPFMGSGTTGVAAIQSGRTFIGIEKEREYFNIAVERIRKAIIDKQGGPMFAEHEPKKQAEAFG